MEEEGKPIPFKKIISMRVSKSLLFINILIYSSFLTNFLYSLFVTTFLDVHKDDKLTWPLDDVDADT